MSEQPRDFDVDFYSNISDHYSSMLDSVAVAVPLEHIDSRIAASVRVLRSELGMTLAALAEKSGVSRSMLSLIERGETSPTAVVLEKVATALGVSLATLFDDPTASADPVSRSDSRVPWRDPQSGYIRRNISPPGFPSPIQIVEVALPAGTVVAYETAGRDIPVHQQIWVQEGRVEITVGSVVHKLTVGDCLAMQLNEPTTFRNRTSKAARYFVIVATERPRAPRR